MLLHRIRLATLVLLFLVVLVFPVSPSANNSVYAQGPTPPAREPEQPLPPETEPIAGEELSAAQVQLLQDVADANGVPADQLLLGYSEEMVLPLTGITFTYGKVVDKVTGDTYVIALDENGLAVDADTLWKAERETRVALYGKLHPSLANHLQTLSGSEAATVRVSIWLDMGGRDASIQRIDPSRAEGMSAEAIRQHEAEGAARATQIHQEVEQPLLDFLPTVGGQVISAVDTAPMVFAEVPVKAIQQIAALSYVDTIDLLVEGGPEDEGEGEGEGDKQAGEPELSTAQPASKANVVQARGFNGTGVVSAVIEGDSIAFANPYLADGICGPTASCPTLDDHPTTVGGIMASNHSAYRGVAPGIGTNLRSGNGGGWNLSNHQSATTWANGQGADVYNNSYLIEADGVMHNSDRWMDYIVRVWADLEVKSAGNRGTLADKFVTSPGLGYNTLTVGSVDDQNTVSWTGDTMSAFSSYNEPAGREKPEVSAIGCGNYGGGVGIISTGVASPWIYDQGCGTSYAAPIVTGGGALLIDRIPGLASWPESEKAILIATALHNIEGSSRISEIDGAGAVDLAAADTVAANNWWRGHFLTGSNFTSQLFTSMTIYLYAGERVRVALAYDSNPSADYTSDPLQGDLDLRLLNPSATLVASSAGVDSWEIIDYTTTVSGTYTVQIYNFGNSLLTTESTYAGVAVWPGHYVLSPYAGQVRDQPSGNWNQDSGDDYRFTRGSFWNAVGVRPPTGADYDIYLFGNSVYGNPADHSLLNSSTFGGSAMDIVLVDGNHAPSGNYYTTISRFAGTGNYQTEFATHTADLNPGTYGPYSADGDTLRVWDIHFNVSEKKYVCVAQQAGGTADLGILLFDSDPASSASLYKRRSQAVASVDKTDNGGNEYLVYTSPDEDWKGFVVYSKSGTSTYNVTVSSSPIASCNEFVDWAGGVSITANRNVVPVGSPVIGAQFMTYNGFNAGSTTVYVPMLFKDAFGGSYDSALYVQNLHSTLTANISIKYYDTSGNLICTVPDTIARLSSKGYWLPGVACLGASWVGAAVITSSQNIVAVGRPHIGSEILTYNGFASGSTTAYVPMLYKDAFGGSYDSALYIQNIHPTLTANVFIDYYDTSGNLTCTVLDSIARLSSKGYWLPQVACLGPSWRGAAVITASQNIVALGRPHIGSQIMTYNGFASGSLNAYVPMLYKDAFGGSYDSALYLQNVNPSSTATIAIKFYDPAGALTCTVNDVLSPLASKDYWLPGLACLGASWQGSAKVESNLNVVAVGRPYLGSEIMAYDGAPSGSLSPYLPMLFRNAFGGSYDSTVFLVNTDAVNSASVTLNFFDTEGILSCTRVATIPARGTINYYLPSLVCNPP